MLIIFRLLRQRSSDECSWKNSSCWDLLYSRTRERLSRGSHSYSCTGTFIRTVLQVHQIVGRQFDTQWHKILYSLHLVLKFEIKDWNFAFSLQLWSSNRITKKIWDWRSIYLHQNQCFVESDLHLMPCSDQHKIFSNGSYWSKSPIICTHNKF